MPYVFNFPLVTQMTDPQQAVLDETGPVAISGGPGTGKSVVSLWRHIRNHDLGIRDSLLITYAKTLTVYLRSCATPVNENAGNAVKRSLPYLSSLRPRRYDEIIIDEAQDINHANYEILRRLADMVSYGADDQQILYPNEATTEAELATMFPANVPHPLDENFRNTYEIMLFTQAAFPNRRISAVMMQLLRTERSSGIKPICMLANSQVKKDNALLEIIAEFQGEAHNIGILVPRRRDVSNVYNFLQQNRIACSCYFHNGREIDEIENIHVTTFKSAKGIEFDTVILPDFDLWRQNIRRHYVVEENDYFVAFTRARRNLFLISNTDQLWVNASTFDIKRL